MSNPPFVFQKVSNHGTTHPVVARLLMQTHELLQFTRLDQSVKEDVMTIYGELHRRLLQCHDIAVRIFAERDRTVAAFIGELGKGNSGIPYVINLEAEAESFLYVAKQYLRDLVKALNLLLGANLPVDASVWWDKKGGGKSDVVKWATKTYGEQHPTTKMFAEEDIWVSELVKKRNAAEHHGGHSGTLVIDNYKFGKDGLIAPSWRRDGSVNATPTDIFHDIRVNLENMLTLAEDIVAVAVHQEICDRPIRIAEIPVDQRDEAKPIRLKAVLVDELLRKLPTDQSE